MEYQHSQLLAKLLPIGDAFNTGLDSNLSKLLKGLGAEFDRVADQASGLISEANPISMSHLTSVRMEEAGLPDACRGPVNTEQEQRGEVLGRWAAQGGQNIAFYRQQAALYGFETRISEYPIFHIEETPIESLGIDDAFNYSFRVKYIDNGLVFFRASQSSAGEYLSEFGTGGLPCLFERIKPAHTTVVYSAFENGTDLDAVE
jgi:uncharacterized protein YmfQ (DUF2313 family)